ncbi:hypothetical protein DKG75_02415 [Zavarzinia compransoris]|uniref:Outer envelope protein n=1 Tax=Zavarzinia compransoris TaxID=1264899 RepID=A0A317EAY4_9PROT|nr:hypothetical protein DKG75_02415 [Zavarzinia compransoris]
MKGGFRRGIAGLAVAGAALLGGAGAAQADIIQWSDTFVGVRYGATYAEPTNNTDVEKVIVQGQHVSGWTYGQNFINVDILFDLSKSDEPAKDGASPAKEIYAVFREKLSASKIFGLGFGGWVRDMGLTIGGDLSYKDDSFNARVRKFVIGPTIDFDVPGFWSVSFLLGTESNNNSILSPSVGVDFEPAFRLETAWGLPIPIDIGVPVTFKGFMNIVGPKGPDGFGQNTVTEILLDTAIMFDVGAPFGQEKTFMVGFGYQWWKNKFGNDPEFTGGGKKLGTEASVPQFVAEFHF